MKKKKLNQGEKRKEKKMGGRSCFITRGVFLDNLLYSVQ